MAVCVIWKLRTRQVSALHRRSGNRGTHGGRRKRQNAPMNEEMPIEVDQKAGSLWDEVGSPQTATSCGRGALKLLAACDDLVMVHCSADATRSKYRVLDRLRRGDHDELEDRGLGNTERKSYERLGVGATYPKCRVGNATP